MSKRKQPTLGKSGFSKSTKTVRGAEFRVHINEFDEETKNYKRIACTICKDRTFLLRGL